MTRYILLLASLALAVRSADALINPNFTPVDLVRGAREIWQLEVSAPQQDTLTARLVRAHKGAAPAADKLRFDLAEADDETLEHLANAFAGNAAATGMLFTGDLSRASMSGAIEGPPPAAVVQIGLHWFALMKTDDQWHLVADPLDLSAVWGGSATMLVECTKYVLSDPRAEVPATAGTNFTSDQRLGNVGAKLTGMRLRGPGQVVIFSQEGDRLWEFPAMKETKLDTNTPPPRPPVELINDFDGDGVLDKLIADAKRPRLLRSQSTDITAATGELEYHSRSKPDIVGMVDCDFNHDGHPDVWVLYRGIAPLAFYNRGFGTFGLARELLLEESNLPAAKALADGALAALCADLNGDGSQDLLAVAANGDLWALYTTPDRPPGPSLLIALSADAAGPVTVIAQDSDGRQYARQIGRDQPAQIYLSEPGPLSLRWPGPDGKQRQKQIIVERQLQQVVLPSESD
jgi:hypothetical protein